MRRLFSGRLLEWRSIILLITRLDSVFLALILVIIIIVCDSARCVPEVLLLCNFLFLRRCYWGRNCSDIVIGVSPEVDLFIFHRRLLSLLGRGMRVVIPEIVSFLGPGRWRALVCRSSCPCFFDRWCRDRGSARLRSLELLISLFDRLQDRDQVVSVRCNLINVGHLHAL